MTESQFDDFVREVTRIATLRWEAAGGPKLDSDQQDDLAEAVATFFEGVQVADEL